MSILINRLVSFEAFIKVGMFCGKKQEYWHLGGLEFSHATNELYGYEPLWSFRVFNQLSLWKG